MPKAESKKQSCEVCGRDIDVRGIRNHLRKHGIERMAMAKKPPASADVESPFERGIVRGMELAFTLRRAS